MRILATLLIIFCGLLLIVRILENRLVFYPIKYPNGTWHPEWLGLQVEDCLFTAADGVKLHGWLLRHPAATATLLWCHGNAGNITDRLDNLQRLAQLPVNVFIFDYRGYGKSDGEPTEAGVYLDAQAAYDFLVAQPGIDPARIVVFGRSLGGAVAVDLATRRPCLALILESTFTRATDMARRMFPVLPVQLVMRSRFDSVSKIQNLRVPKLILHGTADEVVPFELGQKLFDAAPEPKTFHPLEGAGHNDTYIAGDNYWQVLGGFLDSLPRPSSSVPKP